MRSLALSLLLIACDSSHVLESVPKSDVLKKDVAAPVDVVRDEMGVPHIYGESLSDVAYAQGWVQAQDRLVQLDLARHLAEGRLAEIAGELSESIIDQDIQMRMHHLGAT